MFPNLSLNVKNTFDRKYDNYERENIYSKLPSHNLNWDENLNDTYNLMSFTVLFSNLFNCKIKSMRKNIQMSNNKVFKKLSVTAYF